MALHYSRDGYSFLADAFNLSLASISSVAITGCS